MYKRQLKDYKSFFSLFILAPSPKIHSLSSFSWLTFAVQSRRDVCMIFQLPFLVCVLFKETYKAFAFPKALDCNAKTNVLPPFKKYVT